MNASAADFFGTNAGFLTHTDRRTRPIRQPRVGASLGIPTGMKAATHATENDLRAKHPGPSARSREKLRECGDSSRPPVLVVDDELLIRWSVSEILSGLGYAVAQASDAKEAWHAVTAADAPFEVVVLDLRLPDMSDLSLLRRLREFLPHADLILMTAFGATDVIEEARALGAIVLHKPFELTELERIVSRPGAGRH